MIKKKILVDDTKRELCAHGSETFPMTVNHDDLWMFEGKNVPIHWHNELEISLPRLGKARYQVYQKNYEVHPGEGLLLNRNVPHSCDSTDDSRTLYTTILVRPDFLYGDLGSDVERNCFRPFLQNSALPCILLTGKEEWSREALKKLNQVDTLFEEKPFCYELRIKGLLCEAFGLIFSAHGTEFRNVVPASQRELERLEQMLDYLHAHSESVVSLKELADQVHLSREVCCRLFRKMTGKTITKYLEEYRVNQSFPGSERSVSDDPDRRYGRLQQCQPFCRRFSETVRVQSRRIQFFEAAETEKGLCRVFIIERFEKLRFGSCGY